jgi:hypothetical protein
METKVGFSKILSLCSTGEKFEQNSHATVSLISPSYDARSKKACATNLFFKK